MSNHSFMFLNDAFPNIAESVARMEKNLVEGDGIDAVVWAGRIAEKITQEIASIISLDLEGLNQYEILKELEKFGVIPEERLKEFHYIRGLRNKAMHEDLKGEIYTAKKIHYILFRIACWFYGTYFSDETYFNLEYPGILYKHDKEFIKKISDNIEKQNEINLEEIKSIISESVDVSDLNMDEINDYGINEHLETFLDNDSVFFNKELNRWTACVSKNGKIITVGHFKTRRDALIKGSEYIDSEEFMEYESTLIPTKRKDGKYSSSKDVTFDEELEMWTAFFNKKSLGYFISESSAKVVRKEYIDTLPIPEKKNGRYSDYEGISFDKNHKLWFVRHEGIVKGYYDTEKEAIEAREKILNPDDEARKLGITEQEDKWIVTYQNEFIGEYFNEEDAVEARHNYIKENHLPKKNEDGSYSIHKGIDFDEENYVWTVKVQDELLGYFDNEEDAFYFKKEFLADKGVDVSELVFEDAESLDYEDDFKAEINSDENGVIYNEKEDKWIARFRGRELGEFESEDDGRKYRKKYLKSIPFPPRKSNGKYSLYEGIGYNINRHLWFASLDDLLLGFYDSEEDAFYARKEYMAKNGLDVKNMQFIKGDMKRQVSFSKSSESEIIDEEEINELTEKDVINKVPSINKKRPVNGFSALFNNANKTISSQVSKNNRKSKYMNRKFSKEINFNSYDELGYKKEINLTYDNEKAIITLIGRVHKDDLRYILFFDLLNNLEKIDYTKSDEEYFDVSLKLNYLINELQEGKLLNILSKLDWKCDIFDFLMLQEPQGGFSNISYIIDDGEEEELPNFRLDNFSHKTFRKDYSENNVLEIDSEETKQEELIKEELKTNEEGLFELETIKSPEKPKKKRQTSGAIIRNGRRVTAEEAEAIDNKVEKLEIKSNIISERPEEKKPSFKTYDLDDIALVLEDEYEENELVLLDEFEDVVKDTLGDINDNIIEDNEEDEDIFELDEIEVFTPKIEPKTTSSGAIIRNGRRVTAEEAEAIDNMVKSPEIKSNVISERPEEKKPSFKTYTLDGISSITGEDEKSNLIDLVEDNDKVIIRDGRRVTAEEAEAIDNRVESPEIKSDIIEKVPKEEKVEYKTNSIKDVISILNTSRESKKVEKEDKIHAPDAFDVKYADSLEVYYDEEKDKYLAVIDGTPLKFFDTPKEAYLARKKRLRRIVNKPRRMLNGKYSNFEGIDFNQKELMWSIAVNGIVIGYSINEKKAIATRKFFIEKVLEPNGIEVEKFDEEKYDELCDSDWDLHKMMESKE